MIFTHLVPFRTPTDTIVTMKALLTINDQQFVECYENNQRYKPDQLTDVTKQEYQEYLDNDLV